MIKTLLCAKSSISMISPALYVADNLLKVNVKYFKLVYYGTITRQYNASKSVLYIHCRVLQLASTSRALAGNTLVENDLLHTG